MQEKETGIEEKEVLRGTVRLDGKEWNKTSESKGRRENAVLSVNKERKFDEKFLLTF